MRIKIVEDKAFVFTPYSTDFVTKIKAIGGAKWDAGSKAWEIPSSSIESVREFMMEVYGETDISPSSPKVDVKIEAIRLLLKFRGEYSIMGRTIARAWGRDSGAKVGDGVDFLVGSPESGGSVKNWTTEIPVGSVFVIHGVAESVVERFLRENHPDMKIEILQSSTINRKALEEERKRLIKRIEEINSILG